MVLDEKSRKPLPINSLERTKLQIPEVTLSLQTGAGYPGASNSYYGVGNLTCTNYRLIFTSEPPLPLFDSLMVTWNQMDVGEITSHGWWKKSYGYAMIVRPLEDEEQLRGTARLRIGFGDKCMAETFAKVVKESRWTGHLDPENAAEPPPAYPIVSQSRSNNNTPPPTYDSAINQ